MWGGDVFVDFELGLNFGIRQIRAALGDDPETARYIQTVPRRGYRFVAQVEVVGSRTAAGTGSCAAAAPTRTVPERPVATLPAPASRSGSGRRTYWALGPAAVSIAALAWAYLFLHRQAKSAPPAESRILLAVLPFKDLNPSPEQEYLRRAYR